MLTTADTDLLKGLGITLANVQYAELCSKRTSVKQMLVVKPYTETETGIAHIYMTGNYSVFDWGAMPMETGVSYDNSTLMMLSAFFFEKIRELGIPTHYRGLVMQNSDVVDFQQSVARKEIPVAMEVDFVERVEPLKKEQEYDYEPFANIGLRHMVIPIEFIFREPGPISSESSFAKRWSQGSILPQDYGLPLDWKLEDGFPWRVIDWSTKYEEQDQYLPPDVLQIMAGLTTREFYYLNTATRAVAELTTDIFAKAGLHVPDGKVEYIISGTTEKGRTIKLADLVGTWHENRVEILPYGKLTKRTKISKQTERNIHKKRDRAWFDECEAMKKEHPASWKDHVKSRPKPLPAEYFKAKNQLHRAGVNTVVDQEVYPDTPTLDDAAVEFNEMLKATGLEQYL